MILMMLYLLYMRCRAPCPHVMRQYQSLLSKALANTDDEVLSDHHRTELRVFRVKHGVNSAAHLSVLKKLGWTVDEYEVRIYYYY